MNATEEAVIILGHLRVKALNGARFLMDPCGRLGVNASLQLPRAARLAAIQTRNWVNGIDEAVISLVHIRVTA